MRNSIGVRCVLPAALALALAAGQAGGQDWIRRTPATRPPARHDHAMAYDAARQRVVLFGGVRYGGAFNDTWEWDGVTWTQRKPAASPGIKRGHAMVYDTARQRVVLFGSDALQPTNDTWEWNGTTWTQRTPATSPAARVYPAMAYDAARRRVVLFGGMGRSLARNETWEWDGTTWTQRHPAVSPPGLGMMAYDAARRRVVLFGSCSPNPYYQPMTWEWDGRSWTRRNPASTASQWSVSAMVYDAARRRIVLFGGSHWNDTWEWDGMTWRQRWPATRPSVRAGHAMAYDAARQRVVLFGGQGFWRNDLDDTWEYGFRATVALAGSPRLGGTVSLGLTAVGDAGLPYQAGSSLGTGPIGVGSRRIHLSPDALLKVSLAGLWPSVFSGYAGLLDGRGQASAAIHIPNVSALVGTRIHTAFLTLDPPAPWGIRSISSTQTFTIAR